MYQYQIQTLFQLTNNTTVYAWIHLGFNLQVITFESKVPAILTIPINSSGICTQQSNNARYSDIPDIIAIQEVIVPSDHNNLLILCQRSHQHHVDIAQCHYRHSRVGNRINRKQYDQLPLLFHYAL